MPPDELYWITVTVAAPEVTPLAVAVMLAVPTCTAVANPPGEVMVATLVSEEVQVQLFVTLPIEPSW